ncbi:hypothetical protein [uncultured Polaribacter sp.]|uniref:hypothetical protein n=1 Tax=uncultured Polaribacter sp. TaxID=174711 RepID=UPI002633E882|nr:hypothetical protein [uncultured Polaribacter sp.]
MANKNNIFKNSKDKADVIISLITIVFFSLFVFLMFFNVSDKQAEDVNTKIKASKKAPNTSKIKEIEVNKEYSEDTTQYQNNTEVATTTSTPNTSFHKEDKVNKEHSEDNTLETTKTTPNKIIHNKSEVNDDFNEVTTKNKVDDNDTSLNSVIKKPSENQIINEESSLNEATSIKKNTNTDFNCVAIVGVFKELKNKTNTINKLIALGYKPTEGVLQNGLNFVGVPLNCNNKKEKRKLLNQLNQDLKIKPWIKKIKSTFQN